MVPIGKKPTPDDHDSSLKIFLARCPCAIFIYLFEIAWPKYNDRDIFNFNLENVFYQFDLKCLQKHSLLSSQTPEVCPKNTQPKIVRILYSSKTLKSLY